MKNLFVIWVCLLVSGCASSVYVNHNRITEIGTTYSDTDLRMIADDMVTSLLSTKRIYESGEKPTIIMGKIENKTLQHIDMGAILSKIETQLINSDQVRFVNRKILEKMAEEQALNQTMGNGKVKSGQIIGGQYRLDGEMTEISKGGGRIRYYRIALWLTDNSTSEKVWANEKEIKKKK